MTVLTWGTAEGVKGRCDAKCHQARSVKCTCMCGGRYHGALRLGRFQQVYQTHAADILAAATLKARDQGLVLVPGPHFVDVARALRDARAGQLELGL